MSNAFATWAAKAARFKAEADAAASAGGEAVKVTSALQTDRATIRAKLTAVEAEIHTFAPGYETPRLNWLRAERVTLQAQFDAATEQCESHAALVARLAARHQAARQLADGAADAVDRLRREFGPGASSVRLV